MNGQICLLNKITNKFASKNKQKSARYQNFISLEFKMPKTKLNWDVSIQVQFRMQTF